MSTQAQERETEVVTGQVTAVIAKGGDKYQIAVLPTGSQYTKNLWTKDFGLVQQMEANINNHYSFVCAASYWARQDGQQVRSLWINQITAPGQVQEAQPPTAQSYSGGVPPHSGAAAQQAQQPQVQGQPGISPLEKEERIMREHAMGVVALMLPHMKPEERNAAGMINVAEGLIAYYRLGPPGANGQPQEETPPPPEGDDGIPF